jgi:ornithine carbamoyltransferase
LIDIKTSAGHGQYPHAIPRIAMLLMMNACPIASSPFVDGTRDPQAIAILSMALLVQRGCVAKKGLSLKGRRIGLLCEGSSESARLVREAAEGLGAQVVCIGQMWRVVPDLEDLHRTAEAIGRMYDAVDCEGMPPELLDAFHHHCGIPVFDGLGSNRHPIANLADLLDGSSTESDRHRFIVQGSLLQALA